MNWSCWPCRSRRRREGSRADRLPRSVKLAPATSPGRSRTRNQGRRISNRLGLRRALRRQGCQIRESIAGTSKPADVPSARCFHRFRVVVHPTPTRSHPAAAKEPRRGRRHSKCTETGGHFTVPLVAPGVRLVRPDESVNPCRQLTVYRHLPNCSRAIAAYSAGTIARVSVTVRFQLSAVSKIELTDFLVILLISNEGTHSSLPSRGRNSQPK